MKTPEERREYHKRWRNSTDREKFLEGQRRRHRKWYENNIEKAREMARIRQRLYRERYPERYLESLRKAARKRKIANKHMLDEYKKKHPCVDCGETDYIVLDFHHRDPREKGFTISAYKHNKSLDKMLEEVEKCDVLCANCHRRRHYRR